ncbi:hypothetical protein BY996DRAFT_6501505 [Phakopsora pachyrhizi]|nr:hypothetical protein BY996DRAFT_6501505 [Phakopsora pachyrhizi]
MHLSGKSLNFFSGDRYNKNHTIGAEEHWSFPSRQHSTLSRLLDLRRQITHQASEVNVDNVINHLKQCSNELKSNENNQKTSEIALLIAGNCILKNVQGGRTTQTPTTLFEDLKEISLGEVFTGKDQASLEPAGKEGGGSSATTSLTRSMVGGDGGPLLSPAPKGNGRGPELVMEAWGRRGGERLDQRWHSRAGNSTGLNNLDLEWQRLGGKGGCGRSPGVWVGGPEDSAVTGPRPDVLAPLSVDQRVLDARIPASEVWPLAEEEKRKERGGGLTNTLFLEAVEAIAGAVLPGQPCHNILTEKERMEEVVVTEAETEGVVWMMRWQRKTKMAKVWEARALGKKKGKQRPARVTGPRMGPGWVIPGRGKNMTPGEILAGVQKSGAFLKFSGWNLLEGTSDGKTMQGVLDWMRAGLLEGMESMEEDMDGAGVEAAVVEGLVKEYEGKEVKGTFCWILLGFEEEGVAVEGNEWHHRKEEKKLGGCIHQGQSDWNKTTGATDLYSSLRSSHLAISPCLPSLIWSKEKSKERAEGQSGWSKTTGATDL